MDGFLSKLCPLKVTLLRPATPFPPNEPLPPVPVSPDPRDLTTAAGVEMIYLPAGWWAGRFEVTQAQYESVMQSNPSIFKDPHRPVECVSWSEATEFCRRLTERERTAGRLPEGMEYRLPTAQEFADMDDTTQSIRAVMTTDRTTRWQTARVGSVPANSRRLHDVVGNVWEWSHDWWDQEERFKLSWGGAWVNDPEELQNYDGDPKKLPFLSRMLLTRLRGPYRRDLPDQGFWDRGFRVVLARPALPQTIFARDREEWRRKP
jgi:formylglycine-generating enzyme required for sulfatase activity